LNDLKTKFQQSTLGMLSDDNAASTMTTQSVPQENGTDQAKPMVDGVATTSADEPAPSTLVNGTESLTENGISEPSSSAVPNDTLPMESARSDDEADNEETPETKPETIRTGPSDIPLRGPVQGWETPPQEHVNGVVQPRVEPPPNKPTRHTNQLEYIAKEVLKPARTHKHAWPFLKPVDAVKLGITDYHKVIKRPMDLTTIEKRLKNVYYYSAEDCMRDIMTMFNNCYTYNPPHYGVYTMAKDLERFILSKMAKMPSDVSSFQDFESIFQNCYAYNQNEDDVALMCKNVENLYQDRIRKMPKEEYEIPKTSQKRPGKKSSLHGGSRSSVTPAAGIGSVCNSPSSSAPSEAAAAVLNYFHNATVQGAPYSFSFVQKVTYKRHPTTQMAPYWLAVG
jgi:hypothetical protein